MWRLQGVRMKVFRDQFYRRDLFASRLRLQQLAWQTTRCGRFRTYNRTHCGRCVP